MGGSTRAHHEYCGGCVTESKAQRVYRELSEGISRGEYSPGYRLVLSRLAEDFDVSPVPVREAVRRLEAEGRVRHTRNVGFEVAGVDADRYSEAMESMGVLEAAATALAAPHLTPADLDDARALNERMRNLDLVDPSQFTVLNQRFHRVLTDRCPNGHLLEMLHREWAHLAQLRRSSFGLIPDRARDSVREHDALLDLLDAGAPAAQVETAVREHTRRTRDLFVARATDADAAF